MAVGFEQVSEVVFDQRLVDAREQIATFAVNHGDTRLRAFYRDWEAAMAEPDGHILPLMHTLVKISPKVLTADLVNAIPRALIGIELDLRDPRAPINASFLRDRDKVGSWRPAINSLSDPDVLAMFMGFVMMPVQSNVPSRARGAKITAVTEGKREGITVLELGSSMGAYINQLVREHEFPYDPMQVGIPSDDGESFIVDAELTDATNTVLQDSGFSVENAVGIEIVPPFNRAEMARIIAQSLYPTEMLDPLAVARLQAMISDVPPSIRYFADNVASFERRAEFDDLCHDIAPNGFDVVIASAMLYQSKQSEQLQIVNRIPSLLKPDGIGWVQDFMKFSSINRDGRRSYGKHLPVSYGEGWPKFSFTGWLYRNSRPSYGYEKTLLAETGRLNRVKLEKQFGKRVLQAANRLS